MRVSSGDDSNNGNLIDPLSKQESIVKIMVESPKEPPNVEFGVAFPHTTVVQIKTESIEQQQQQPQSTDGTSTTAVQLAADIQEPIDVNIPRDTTNIFYAYEETEIDNSFHEQQQQQQQQPPRPQSQQSTLDMPEISQQTIPPNEQAEQIAMPTGNTSSNNQSVNIEQDSTHAPDPSQSDNQFINLSSISGDNFKSSS